MDKYINVILYHFFVDLSSKSFSKKTKAPNSQIELGAFLYLK